MSDAGRDFIKRIGKPGFNLTSEIEPLVWNFHEQLQPELLTELLACGSAAICHLAFRDPAACQAAASTFAQTLKGVLSWSQVHQDVHRYRDFRGLIQRFIENESPQSVIKALDGLPHEPTDPVGRLGLVRIIDSRTRHPRPDDTPDWCEFLKRVCPNDAKFVESINGAVTQPVMQPIVLPVMQTTRDRDLHDANGRYHQAVGSLDRYLSSIPPGERPSADELILLARYIKQCTHALMSLFLEPVDQKDAESFKLLKDEAQHWLSVAAVMCGQDPAFDLADEAPPAVRQAMQARALPAHPQQLHLQQASSAEAEPLMQAALNDKLWEADRRCRQAWADLDEYLATLRPGEGPSGEQLTLRARNIKQCTHRLMSLLLQRVGVQGWQDFDLLEDNGRYWLSIAAAKLVEDPAFDLADGAPRAVRRAMQDPRI